MEELARMTTKGGPDLPNLDFTINEVIEPGDTDDEAYISYVIYQNAEQMRCPCCAGVRFRLRSAGRRIPSFACRGCGQMLEKQNIGVTRHHLRWVIGR